MVNPTFSRSPYATVPFDLKIASPRVLRRPQAKAITKPRVATRQSPLRWADVERTLLSVIALIAVVYVVQSYRTQTGPFMAAPAVASIVTVTTAPGDTVWSLAGRYESHAINGEQRLARVRAVNPGMDISHLRPGMKLRIPVTTGAV